MDYINLTAIKRSIFNILFFLPQFFLFYIAAFNWSNIATLFARSGTEFLKNIHMTGLVGPGVPQRLW